MTVKPSMTFDELMRFLPDAHMETGNERNELVVYTGWKINDDGELVEMDDA